MITLYPHQQQTVDAVFQQWKTNRFALAELFVGAGKSHIIAAIAKQVSRVVILQPALELVMQNHSKLTDAGLNTTMIESVHKGDWNADYIYTTPQTLHKNLDKIDEPEVLIIDEAAMFFSGTMLNTIFRKWRTCKVFGCTATPYYYETKTIYNNGYMWSKSTCRSIAQDLYGLPVVQLNRQKGRELGYGCDIKINRAKIEKIKTMHLNAPSIYAPMLRNHLLQLKELLLKCNNAIIYCDSIKHAEFIANTFKIPTIFGKTSKKERLDTIDKLKSGQVKYVATVGCLKLGFDFPELENIIILTNINNECDAEQIIGRLNRGKGIKNVWHNCTLNSNIPVVGKETLIRLCSMDELKAKRKRW